MYIYIYTLDIMTINERLYDTNGVRYTHTVRIGAVCIALPTTRESERRKKRNRIIRTHLIQSA